MENKLVFTHGNIVEIKNRKGELVVRVKDEKGEWEGYIDEKNAPLLSEGNFVRAHGTISPQPDGRNVLACAWIKPITEDEKQFCERKTREAWETILQQNPTLNETKPFERSPPRLVNVETKIISPAKNDTQEFISAAEIKVEREYL